MANNDKAWVWQAMDLSDGEEALEKLACRFQKVEDAQAFKDKFNAAREFNAKARGGASDEELEWAELVEDIEAPEVDDIDTNKTADAEGDDNWDLTQISTLQEKVDMLEQKEWWELLKRYGRRKCNVKILKYNLFQNLHLFFYKS